MLKNTQKLDKRNSTMDMIRIVSVLLVMSVHFFLYTGFYDQPMLGKRMFALCAMRTFFTCCVPMFLLLSGYLMWQKKPEKEYSSAWARPSPPTCWPGPPASYTGPCTCRRLIP